MKAKGTDLVKRDTVEDMVNQRNAAIDRYRELVDAEKRLCETWGRASGTTYGPPSEFRLGSGGMASFIKKLDRDCWSRAAKMTRVDELMDVKARKAFHDQMDREPPEFTVDNVLATLSHLMASAGDIFKSSVVATFEALPSSYKSNDGFKYGKKIIFDYAFDPRYGLHFYGHGWAAERLRDLDRVMAILDDQKFDTQLDAVSMLSKACGERRYGSGEPVDCETRYFKLRVYKKGSMHVTPKRKDLITKANKLLAQHYGETLPDGRQS